MRSIKKEKEKDLSIKSSQLIENIRDGHIMLVSSTHPVRGIVLNKGTSEHEIGTCLTVENSATYSIYNGELILSNE